MQCVVGVMGSCLVGVSDSLKANFANDLTDDEWRLVIKLKGIEGIK